MQIQKSSVYLSSVGARSTKTRVDALSRTQETQAKAPDRKEVRKDLAPTKPRTPIPPVADDPVEPSPIHIHSIDRQRLSELNPRLDRTTRNAIDAYVTMQHQTEIDQRDSVSKMLGVDLYI